MEISCAIDWLIDLILQGWFHSLRFSEVNLLRRSQLRRYDRRLFTHKLSNLLLRGERISTWPEPPMIHSPWFPGLTVFSSSSGLSLISCGCKQTKKSSFILRTPRSRQWINQSSNRSIAKKMCSSWSLTSFGQSMRLEGCSGVVWSCLELRMLRTVDREVFWSDCLLPFVLLLCCFVAVLFCCVVVAFCSVSSR